jgi:four helix bundle protein
LSRILPATGRSPANRGATFAGRNVGRRNAEETKAAYTRREFACKNSLVLREARESRFWLRLIVATQLASVEQVEPLLAESDELVGMYTATVKKAIQPRT